MVIAKNKRNLMIALLILVVAAGVFMCSSLFLTSKANAARSIIFPVIGPASYTNDFHAPRPNGQHRATDIFAAKGRQLVATVDGTITYVAYPQPSYGYMVSIKDNEGYTYNYLHINNDRPGTDDGLGGGMFAYAPDMLRSNPIKKGQLIGWVGDSGNAENTPPHLHFEIVAPDGTVLNPYDSLQLAHRIGAPNPYPQLPNELLPYGVGVGSMVNVAMGNFDGDTALELVAGAGRGGGPHVRLFDANNSFMGRQFFAYAANFYGGVDVAAGDVDGDGIDEIITGPGPSGGPHVRILKLDGSEVGGFFAYASDFTGGIHVAAGDIDNDGSDEIITSPGPGGGPHIRIFEPNGTEIKGFYAYGSQFMGGVDVSSGDVTGSVADEVVTSAGPGAGPHVRIFTGQGAPAGGFAAYENFASGVRVSVGDVRTSLSKDEIVVAPYGNGGPHIRMFRADGTLLTQRMYMEQWWVGTYDITAGDGKTKVGTGINRRTSIRAGVQ